MVKKVLAGLLVIGVGIVWIPQLLSAKSDTKPTALPEVPATGELGTTQGAASTHADVDANAAGAANGPDAAVAGPVDEGRPDAMAGVNLAGSFESAVARARTLVAKPGSSEPIGGEPEVQGEPTTRADGAVQQDEAAQPAPGRALDLPTLRDPSTEHVDERVTFADDDSLAPPIDPIDAFLAAHPLQGTVLGASDRVATLGPLLVRVGDELLPGLVVTGIQSRHVELRREGRTIRVDLEPFRARAPSATSAGSGGAANTTGDSAGKGSPNGASGNANAAAAQAGLEQLLPKLQEANRALGATPSTTNGSGANGAATNSGASGTTRASGVTSPSGGTSPSGAGSTTPNSSTTTKPKDTTSASATLPRGGASTTTSNSLEAHGS